MNIAVIIAIVLAAAWLAWAAGRLVFVDYPQSAVDIARNKLFELRGELFEMANSGEIGFGDPAYQIHRDLINGMIRYAHEISVVHFMLSQLLSSNSNKVIGSRLNQGLKESLGSASKTVRPKLARILEEASFEMLRLMVSRSIVMTIFVGSIAAILTVLHKLSRAYAKRRAGNEASTSRGRVETSFEEILAESRLRGVRRRIKLESVKYVPRRSSFIGAARAAA